MVELHADLRSPAKPPRPPLPPAAGRATTVTACGKMTCVTGMKIGRGGAKWYRRGHFTQRSFQEVSHQDAEGGGKDGKKEKKKREKNAGSFIAGQNEATRRGGPFRRQYPLTNAIWDDFPRVLLFLSLSPPNISIICLGNLYFLPVRRALNKTASFISMPVLLICIFFTCREKECGDDAAGGHSGWSLAEIQHLSLSLAEPAGKRDTLLHTCAV